MNLEIYRKKEGTAVDLGTEKIWELLNRKNLNVGLAYAEVRESKKHFHKITHEIYIVVRGTGKLIVGDDEEIKLEEGMVLYIPPGKPHKVQDGAPLKLYVVSVPPWSEDDHYLID